MRSSDQAPRRPALGFLSPLRYPGGKARVAPYIAGLIRAQEPRPRTYAEPFAGGAGAALRLLADETVESIHINDLDPGIAAFWRAMFNNTDEFVHRVRTAKVSLAAWKRHRNVYLTPQGRSDIELGFATFFLNRCNRSGILNARPIGGLEQQGKWKIDVRFNREELIQRILYLAEFRHRVKITQQDARQFLATLESTAEDVLVYVDPPYLAQGDDLYLDKLSYEDHREIAQQLIGSNLRWFLTYDCNERITEDLYPNHRCARFNVKHTAQLQHVGSEYAVYSDNLAVPNLNILPRDDAEWVVI
jgi:DNA adenine methylase